MTARAVHWEEGMFLRPHHLQAAQRYATQLTQGGDKCDHYYNWGIRWVDLNREALANHRFEIRGLHARFRDGTIVVLPDEGTLPAIDLRAAFERERLVTVYLAVPVLQSGRPNVADPKRPEAGRFLVAPLDIEDENSGQNPQNVPLRLPNLRLLLSTDNREGYEVLEMARVEKTAGGNALPRLDVSYFPPVLATNAWGPLHTQITVAYDRIGGRITLLANLIRDRAIPIDSAAGVDALLVMQLSVLNEAYAILHVLAFAEGVHPLTIYAELCRVVGQLAIFGKQRGTPNLPRYDHDDLARCFGDVIKYLYGLMQEVGLPTWIERPFNGVGFRMQVTIESQEWLIPEKKIFVRVSSDTLTHDQRVNMLMRGGLTMVIGSANRVEDLFMKRGGGLVFAPETQPPRALPTSDRSTYFAVNRAAQEAEWQDVQKSGSMALRINENQIVGNIDGESRMIVRVGAATFDLQFTLVVI